jgi:hypothetical protein
MDNYRRMHPYNDYSDVCYDGTGVGCDYCGCPCHGHNAPLFLNNTDVAKWHGFEPDGKTRVTDLGSQQSMRSLADQHRYLFDVWLNSRVTTDVHYRYGWTDHTPAIGAIETINERHRSEGHIL